MRKTILATMWIALPMAGATLGGRVVDAAGEGVEGAVVAWRAGAGAAKMTRTDAAGRFRVEDVRPGRGVVCAQADPERGLVGNCEWGGSGVEVEVGSEEEESRVTVGMREGTVVRLRVDDPRGVLRGGTPHVVGVFDGAGFFHPAVAGVEEGVGREWVMTAPAGGEYHAAFASPAARFRDTGGQLLRAEGVRRKFRAEARGVVRMRVEVEGR